MPGDGQYELRRPRAGPRPDRPLRVRADRRRRTRGDQRPRHPAQPVVRNWWRREGHALVLDDLVEVLDELLSRLIVGTGANGRMQPDPDTIQQLQERAA